MECPSIACLQFEEIQLCKPHQLTNPMRCTKPSVPRDHVLRNYIHVEDQFGCERPLKLVPLHIIGMKLL